MEELYSQTDSTLIKFLGTDGYGYGVYLDDMLMPSVSDSVVVEEEEEVEATVPTGYTLESFDGGIPSNWTSSSTGVYGWNAASSGGLSGKGFLKGTQSYLEYLPEKQTDFIFTLIGEEFGFLGTIFIIILFLFVITICFYISIKSSHIFGRIIALGVGSNLFIYVILNISMVSGLMPVVGIPLPLISYGGTVMLSIMISIGMVLNIELNHNLKKLSDHAQG